MQQYAPHRNDVRSSCRGCPWRLLHLEGASISLLMPFFETVAELPGLSSPCTMQCCKGLLTAFGLSFTPHIERQTRTDLRLRPHPVDLLLHLAIASVAPLHRIRGRRQQLVIEEREGFLQGRGKELLERLARLFKPQEPTPQFGQWLMLDARVLGEQ